MIQRTKVLACLFLAGGAVLGWAAASADLHFLERATAVMPKALDGSDSPRENGPSCCSEGNTKGELLALAETKIPIAAQAAQQGREEAINFEVVVPADALLEIDGHKTDQAGQSRNFRTPPVAPGPVPFQLMRQRPMRTQQPSLSSQAEH